MRSSKEILELHPVGDHQSITIDVRERPYNQFFGANTKYEIQAELLSDAEHPPIRLIEKELHSTYAVQKYTDTWHFYQQIGLPVMPAFWTHGTSIFMPDMRELGWQFYGKARWKMMQRVKPYPKDPIHDQAFMNLVQGYEFDRVIARTQHFLDIAYHQRVILPPDDPFDLLIHESGKWDTIIWDLGQSVDSTNMTEQFIWEKNKENVEYYFLESIRNLRHGIEKAYR